MLHFFMIEWSNLVNNLQLLFIFQMSLEFFEIPFL